MLAGFAHKLFGSEDLILIICLITASKVKAGYFARLSKGIGGRQGIPILLPLQRQGLARATQTQAGGVCSVLYSVIDSPTIA